MSGSAVVRHQGMLSSLQQYAHERLCVCVGGGGRGKMGAEVGGCELPVYPHITSYALTSINACTVKPSKAR